MIRMDPNEIDPFAMIFITMFVVILASLLFGWALTPRKKEEQPAETPENIMVDLALLSMRMEIATNAIETVLRQRGFKRDAEGARQVREADRSTFEAVKNEHLTKILLQNLGKSSA
jgi:hypothetical protein